MDVQVPRLAESVSEAVLAEWLKPDGSDVAVDEPIATLETDKAAVEIAATDSGVLRHARAAGEQVIVGDVIARIDPAKARDDGTAATAKSPAKAAATVGVPDPKAGSTSATKTVPASEATGGSSATPRPEVHMSPAVRRLVEEHGLDPGAIVGSGKDGRLLKEDVLRHVESGSAASTSTRSANDEPTPTADRPAKAGPTSAGPSARPRAAAPPVRSPAPATSVPPGGPVTSGAAAASDERVVPMNTIRRRIAERLVRAQQTAAILTTFNEVDMTGVLELRARYKEDFEKRHGVKLGFMSFFTRASVLALEEIAELNAEVRGTDIIYRPHVYMGIAVSSPKGLVVPVIHGADQLDFAGIEREIARLAERARNGTLTIDELSGGTFTITNGGVFGSLLSTPILNPPQSGILGMHKIEKRPIALDDQVVIRPMMYVALSYDHRIVDGEQAVTFLVRIKERLEDPERMMLDV